MGLANPLAYLHPGSWVDHQPSVVVLRLVRLVCEEQALADGRCRLQWRSGELRERRQHLLGSANTLLGIESRPDAETGYPTRGGLEHVDRRDERAQVVADRTTALVAGPGQRRRREESGAGVLERRPVRRIGPRRELEPIVRSHDATGEGRLAEPDVEDV